MFQYKTLQIKPVAVFQAGIACGNSVVREHGDTVYKGFAVFEDANQLNVGKKFPQELVWCPDLHLFRYGRQVGLWFYGFGFTGSKEDKDTQKESAHSDLFGLFVPTK
jgi:hypothetical protein